MLPENVNFYNQFPGLMWCKDNDSTFLMANERYARGLGFKKQTDIAGLKDSETPSKVSELADILMREDKNVITHAKSIMMIKRLSLELDRPANLWLAQKSTFHTPGSNKIGTIGYAIEITDYTNLSNLLMLSNKELYDNANKDQFSYTIQENYFDDIELTNRETECLFYLIKGKTARETAAILKVTQKTIEKYIENIKIKTSTTSRSELIDKCLSQGLCNIIPKTLIKNN